MFLPKKRKSKPAKHGAAAIHHALAEGIHIDDAPDICDAFAIRWRDESRVFRVQHSNTLAPELMVYTLIATLGIVSVTVRMR